MIDFFMKIGKNNNVFFVLLCFFLIIIVAYFAYYRQPSANNKPNSDEKFLAKVNIGSFSISYPEDLYPLIKNEDNVTQIDFFLDEYYAKKTENCVLQNNENVEDPCGFGWLTFSVKVALNPDNNSSKNEKITDNKKRTWFKTKNLPWTGSKFNMNSESFLLINKDKNFSIEIIYPYYSKEKLNDEFKLKLLSSFNY
jgi:hypothetical protein